MKFTWVVGRGRCLGGGGEEDGPSHPSCEVPLLGGWLGLPPTKHGVAANAKESPRRILFPVSIKHPKNVLRSALDNMENPQVSSAEGSPQDPEGDISSSNTAGVILGREQASTCGVESREVDEHEAHAGESNQTREGGSDETSEHVNDETNQVAAGVGDLDYIRAFQRSPHSLPHWRNVLSRSRVESSGSILLLSFRQGEGVVSRQKLSHGFERLQATLTDGVAPSATPQAVFVRDISTRMMNSLGPAFNLSPEIFEAQLVQSGFAPASYEDPDSSTWVTRFLPKRHISLRWFSPVLRKDMEPRGMVSRRLLISEGLKWNRYVKRRRGIIRLPEPSRQLHPAVNIFRQEWWLSARTRQKLVPDENPRYLDSTALAEILDASEAANSDSRFLTQSSPSKEPDIVAWEERVTFCWGHRGQERRRMFPSHIHGLLNANL